MTQISFITKYNNKKKGIYNWVKTNKKWLLIVGLLFILLLVCVFTLYLTRTENKKQYEQYKSDVQLIRAENVKNINYLQNELELNKQNAENAQKEIVKAQSGNKTPTVIYKERPVNGKEIVEVVKEKIIEKDPSLPKEALKETDKTIVSPQPNNPDVPVGVYKINNYRNWELGVGVGVHNDKAYVPVSLQRNYKKDRSLMFELHYDPSKQTVNGGEIQWKIHF